MAGKFSGTKSALPKKCGWLAPYSLFCRGTAHDMDGADRCFGCGLPPALVCRENIPKTKSTLCTLELEFCGHRESVQVFPIWAAGLGSLRRNPGRSREAVRIWQSYGRHIGYHRKDCACAAADTSAICSYPMLYDNCFLFYTYPFCPDAKQIK